MRRIIIGMARNKTERYMLECLDYMAMQDVKKKRNVPQKIEFDINDIAEKVCLSKRTVKKHAIGMFNDFDPMIGISYKNGNTVTMVVIEHKSRSVGDDYFCLRISACAFETFFKGKSTEFAPLEGMWHARRG